MLITACAGAETGDVGGFNVQPIRVGDVELIVNEANTPEARRQGLMGLESLPEGMDGMLFSFEAPTSASFHMRNTPMPLDIWWFDEHGVLVGAAEMDPCLNEPCIHYASPGTVRWALETLLGRYDFQPGDMLSSG